MRRRALAIAVASCALPASAWAHAGEPLQPHDLWRAWTWSPAITIPLVLTLALSQPIVKRTFAWALEPQWLFRGALERRPA